jgi:hypothetical protein
MCVAMNRIGSFKRWAIGLSLGLSVMAVATIASGEPNGRSKKVRDDRPLAPNQPIADPHAVVGHDTCTKCHAGEVGVWKNTPHFRTFDELHRRPEAKQIASRLGIQSIKYESNCVNCHYTQQHTSQGTLAVAGVSCESCHGAAKGWLDLHANYGGPNVTRQTEPAGHRQERILRSIELGMRNPVNAYLVAQSCYRCHTVPDERLVNIGGHKAGSDDFELVSWSQGTIRHKFVHSDGKQNLTSSREHLRVLFVAGMIADLEFSLRATAVATEKASFGLTSAQRAQRALARLKSVAGKVDDSTLKQIVQAASQAALKLNNREALETVADQVAQLGLEFASRHNGKELQAIEPFIPPSNRWK